MQEMRIRACPARPKEKNSQVPVRQHAAGRTACGRDFGEAALPFRDAAVPKVKAQSVNLSGKRTKFDRPPDTAAKRASAWSFGSFERTAFCVRFVLKNTILLSFHCAENAADELPSHFAPDAVHGGGGGLFHHGGLSA